MHQSDVIVVGGGLMGAATAFFLRKRGLSVTLLERGLCGQQASGTNFGNVRRQGRFLPQLPLANRSREIWGRLPELIGEDVEFIRTGHLRVGYRPEHVGMMEAYRDNAAPYGLELELISANALRERFPFIGPEAIAGSYSPNDGHANPRLSAPAFARAATRAGAKVVENCEVISIERGVEDFRVETKTGDIYRAPMVQVSAGAWGGRMAAAMGEPVPIQVKGPQMGVTEPVPYAITPVLGVTTKDLPEVIYARQVTRGNIVFGGVGHGPADLDTIRARVRPEVTLQQFGQLKRIVPALAKLNIIRVWSGIEGYMRDDIPVMGPSAKVPGLFYAFGFCGAGFQLGPGVGDVMAELIATGATTTPIEPFSIARFAEKA
ncbi:FAD-binding oxidoreductase [Rhodovarius crocodyli]|uniref:FAD-binding oxidoreductase n=1 Tax=Rhodovarius crocodyli TaxID=1979269 RepID=A0A437M3R9_9PROT|nr:FAD-binding oxidoreductase [Rhodovarius crocodyli]RVT92215.1 FAD-binding oxidoreductase [Rhodovarius crocodyli]